MSFQSMTGFGKGIASSKEISVNVEIKSVNHRFKDIRLKTSSQLNTFFIDMKKRIESSCKRGSFDVFIKYDLNQSDSFATSIDNQKVISFIEWAKKIEKDSGLKFDFSPESFLKSDFQKENDDQVVKLISEPLFEALDISISKLVKSREDEGNKLIENLKEHLDKYQSYFNNIVSLSGTYQESVKARLSKKISELETSVDENRLGQEVVYYLERLEISEEINRIKSHVVKLSELLNTQSTEVGRQIDFFIQELGRETNTIGSKSGHEEISENVVKMKVELEKIREQGLNLQ